MRAMVMFVSAAGVFLAAAASFGQEEPHSRSSRFHRGFDRQAPDEQPNRRPAGRLITAEVVIADVTGEPEPEMSSDKLAELQKAGRVASLTRLKLSALENQPAMLQFGERVPVVTGRTTTSGFRSVGGGSTRGLEDTLRRMDGNKNEMIDPSEMADRAALFVRNAAERAGLETSEPLAIDKLLAALQRPSGDAQRGSRPATQESISMEHLGTLIQVTSRVEDDDSILMELQAEISRLTPNPVRADAENAEAPAELPRTATITTKSTLRIPAGKTVVAGSRSTGTEHGPVQTWILVSASADAARPASVDETSVPELKVFALLHAKADSLAELLQNVFQAENIRIGVDARTNSLIIQGNAADHDVIQALIQRLDEPQERAAVDR